MGRNISSAADTRRVGESHVNGLWLRRMTGAESSFSKTLTDRSEGSMSRRELPNRRPHEVISFIHWGQKFHAGIGSDNQAADVLEVWLNTGKSGTQAETLARDSAVLLSLALQHGVPIEAMRRAVMRDPNGAASGPIGALLDLLAEGDGLSESRPTVPVVSGNDDSESASRGETVEV